MPWDGQTIGDWARELDGADLVVNLAGRSVNCRYSPANREEIMRSRVDSTRVLAQAIFQASSPPKVWLNSSTATIYRSAQDHAQDEETGELGSKEGKWGFSIQVATAWEEAFFERELLGVRRVALRSAMVMGPEAGGPFEVMLKLARRGLGGQMGSGNQMMSWVHEVDFIRAVRFIAAGETHEIVNIVAPNALPNREFMAEIRRAAAVKVGLPATVWMLRLGAFFMSTETELILKSRWVYPKRLLDAGFEFQFPTWREAVADLVKI